MIGTGISIPEVAVMSKDGSWPAWTNKYTGTDGSRPAAVAEFETRRYAITVVPLASIPTASYTELIKLREATEAEFFSAYVASSTAARTFFDSSNIMTNNLAANAPRFTYVNNRRWLLLEDAITNLVARSDNSNMFNIPNSVSVTAGAAGTGMLAGSPACLVGKTAATSHARAQRNTTVTAATPYTVSVHLLKPMSFNGEYIAFGEFAEAGRLLVMNPFTGAITFTGANISATRVVDHGFWWRISVTTSLVGTTFAASFFPAFNTDGTVTQMSAIGTGYVHTVYGLQLEFGTYMTNHVPCPSSATTRAIETLRFNTSIEAIMQRSAASMLVRSGGLQDPLVGQQIILGSDLVTAHTKFIYRSVGSPNNAATGNNAGSAIPAIPGSGGMNNYGAWGTMMSFDASGRALTINGGTVASDANQPGQRTTIYLGRPQVVGGDRYADGLYNCFVLYPNRVSNAAMQALAVPP